MSAIAVAVVIAETLAQAQGRRREGRRSTTRCCRRWSIRPRRRRRRAADPRGGAEQHDLPLASRRRRRRSTPRSSRPSTSPSSTSSTTGWCRTRWSRAPRSATTMPARSSFTLWNTTQNPHVARLVISAFVGMAPEHKLRVIAPDVGGGFGSKIFIYPEEVVCLWAAQKVGRPVKWTSRPLRGVPGRRARPRPRHPCRDGVRRRRQDPRRCGSKTIANLGAYMSTFSSSVPTYLYATLLSGQYDIPAIYCEVDAVYTNTVPVDAYRGAGRPEATFVVERLVEVGARELGIDPAELRKQNFIKIVPAPDAGDHGLRRRRLSRLAEEGAGARRRQGLRQAQARQRRVTASCAASAIRPISRPAASRRRRRSARSAPASACGNRPRCGSIRPARSKC